MLPGHKRKNKSCLLVYIPWESSAGLGFRLVLSKTEMCCASPVRQLVCVAAAHLRGRICSAFTERVPRIARERSWREEVGGGGRGRAITQREREEKTGEESSAGE